MLYIMDQFMQRMCELHQGLFTSLLFSGLRTFTRLNVVYALHDHVQCLTGARCSRQIQSQLHASPYTVACEDPSIISIRRKAQVFLLEPADFSRTHAATFLGKSALPVAFAAARAPCRANWVAMPSARWVELMFLTKVI